MCEYVLSRLRGLAWFACQGMYTQHNHPAAANSTSGVGALIASSNNEIYKKQNQSCSGGGVAGPWKGTLYNGLLLSRQACKYWFTYSKVAVTTADAPTPSIWSTQQHVKQTDPPHGHALPTNKKANLMSDIFKNETCLTCFPTPAAFKTPQLQ